MAPHGIKFRAVSITKFMMLLSKGKSREGQRGLECSMTDLIGHLRIYSRFSARLLSHTIPFVRTWKNCLCQALKWPWFYWTTSWFGIGKQTTRKVCVGQLSWREEPLSWYRALSLGLWQDGLLPLCLAHHGHSNVVLLKLRGSPHSPPPPTPYPPSLTSSTLPHLTFHHISPHS